MQNLSTGRAELLSVDALAAAMDTSHREAVKRWQGGVPALAVVSGKELVAGRASEAELQDELRKRRPEMSYAEEIGCCANGYMVRRSDMKGIITDLNEQSGIGGVGLALPIPQQSKESDKMTANEAAKLIQKIDPTKDVIGLRGFQRGTSAIQAAPGEYPGATAAAIARLIGQHERLGWRPEVPLSEVQILFAGMQNSLTATYIRQRFQAQGNCQFFDENPTGKPHAIKKELRAMLETVHILVAGKGVSHILRRPMMRPGMLVIDLGVYTQRPIGTLQPRSLQSFGDVDFSLQYVDPYGVARITLREVWSKLLALDA